MKPENTKSNLLVKVEKEFNVPASRVFDAWLDTEKLGLWMFGPSVRHEEIVMLKTDPREGGSFSFIVKRNGEEINHIGKYIEINPPNKLVFTWGIASLSEDESIVSIEIVATKKGCKLTLVHELDPKWKEYLERTKDGWAHMLDKLDIMIRNQ